MGWDVCQRWRRPQVSLSLLDTTDPRRQVTGRTIEVGRTPENRQGDVPLYLSDCARLHAISAWRPRRSAETIHSDIFNWIHAN
jgi:CDP-paratose 2-epimerase